LRRHRQSVVADRVRHAATLTAGTRGDGMHKRIIAWLAFAATVVAHADVTVVEYRHSDFDHYFMTPVPAEIALLDARAPPFELWSRTGVTFRAYENTAATPGAVAICRFFNTSFAPKSSHFYAPRGLGCETTLAGFPDWKLEDDALFAAVLPDATGACAAGTAALYRLYNNGREGAPNHRFVTSLADRQAMLDQGYVAEGAGIGVGMCIPDASNGRRTAEGFWEGTTDQGQFLRIVIFDDGKLFIIFHEQGNGPEAGVLYGSGTSADGKFTSTDVKEYALSLDPRPFIGGAASITGTYVPRTSLHLNIGKSSVKASYVPAYDRPADLASLAGTYDGTVGHITEQRSATATMDARGELTILGVQCNFSVSATPRRSVNVLDISVASGSCYGGPGILIYDEARGKLTALSAFYNVQLGFPDLWYSFLGRR
jgi:hypothetical protein